jgi:hypothetical protein
VSGKSGIDSAVERSSCGRTHCCLFQVVSASACEHSARPRASTALLRASTARACVRAQRFCVRAQRAPACEHSAPACEHGTLTKTQCSTAVERKIHCGRTHVRKLPHSFCCANERAALRSSAPLLPASAYQKAVCSVFKFL